jgi:hypothetical protein
MTMTVSPVVEFGTCDPVRANECLRDGSALK